MLPRERLKAIGQRIPVIGSLLAGRTGTVAGGAQGDAAAAAEYSFGTASEYWHQVPTAHYKLDSRVLAAAPAEEIVREWDRGLDDYLGGWKERGFIPLLDRYRELFRDKTLLEVGCGLGFEHIHFFAPVVRQSFLGDIVPSNVAVVRAVLQAKGLERSTAVLLDYEKGFDFPPLDFIYSHGVLHHIPFDVCRDQVVPRYAALLKPGGRFVIMMYTDMYYRNVRAQSFADFATKTEDPTPGYSNPWSEPYSAEKVQRLFGDAFHLVYERLYNRDNFVMYELEKRAS